MNVYKHGLFDFCWLSQEFWSIFCSLNRCAEFTRLIAWAQKKRLLAPLFLYQNRLEYTERTLFRLEVTDPLAARYARTLFEFKNLLFPTPKFYPKDSAKYYNQRCLTP